MADEKQVAEAVKHRLKDILEEACEQMNLAKEAGLTTNFAIGTDPAGKSFIQLLQVVKVF